MFFIVNFFAFTKGLGTPRFFLRGWSNSPAAALGVSNKPSDLHNIDDDDDVVSGCWCCMRSVILDMAEVHMLTVREDPGLPSISAWAVNRRTGGDSTDGFRFSFCSVVSLAALPASECIPKPPSASSPVPELGHRSDAFTEEEPELTIKIVLTLLCIFLLVSKYR